MISVLEKVINIRFSLLTALFLSHSMCSPTTLHFSQSPDRPLALYRAPAPYQEPGKARLNSVIITSRPFSIGDELNNTVGSNVDTTTSDPQWRRELHVTSSHHPTSPSTTVLPRSSVHIPHFSIDCTNGRHCSETININTTPSPTFKPYSQEVLEKFLNDYAESKLNSARQSSKNETSASFVKVGSSYNKNFTDNRSKDLTVVEPSVEPTNRLANLYLEDEEYQDSVSADGKSKPHWNLIHAQHHNHPYDDRDGWVTLEAVPWSSSKISKWQSSNTGNKRPQWTKPSDHWDNRPSTQNWSPEKPLKPWDRPQYGDRPTDWKYEKPIKPQYLVSNRPTVESWPHESTHNPPFHLERPVSDYNYKPTHGLHQQWITSNHPDIITEGTPENWPMPVNRPGGAGSFKPWPSQETEYIQHQDQYEDDYKYEAHRRPPTPVVYHDGGRPQNYPDSGEGEWVLLSSTKGYSLPVRHHSYQRALTFNTKPITSTRSIKLTVLPALNGTVNTTTSHGGLLEVESTFQTVDEAQRFDALKRVEKNDTRAVPVRLVSRPVQQKGPSKAVLAAVGAGMVPATMALLVPMMLGRKKRSTLVPNINATTTSPIQDYKLLRSNNRKLDEKRRKMDRGTAKRKKMARRIHNQTLDG
ncbi:uncharacterized protein LOC110828104 [Zootermopsis nevadensis]|uniref:Uncharacterized protein n=1 Tax=Zootermopsis nevadensis TaxID=136037 RepID=A0A067RL89_ZOONE|nr:uncharacterized protein LOC110828104 [Zootermopsis nevadensis]KDR21375.1 hypothetical protein L798_03151 [Zootermopsis nevadensis]